MQTTINAYKCLSIIKAAKSTQRDHVLARLPEIKTPALLIWGDDDLITPPAVLRQFENNLPNSKLVMLEECGHARVMERPEAFNKALEEFFT